MQSSNVDGLKRKIRHQNTLAMLMQVCVTTRPRTLPSHHWSHVVIDLDLFFEHRLYNGLKQPLM
jgi:hypothetical protein